MPRFERQALMDRFQDMKHRRIPIVGGGAGTGLSAKCEEEGGIDLAIGNVLRLMMFTHKKESQERDQLVRIAESLDLLTKRLDHIEG